MFCYLDPDPADQYEKDPNGSGSATLHITGHDILQDDLAEVPEDNAPSKTVTTSGV